MDSDEGPIDWGHRMLKVRSREYFIDLAAQQLKTGSEKLTSPHGRLDRKLRGKAIRLFKNDYGLNNVQIAMIMGVTHTTIANILREEKGI